MSSFNKIGQFPAYKCWGGGGGGGGGGGEGRGDQLRSGKDDELLGILIDQKQTFEDQLLNIIQKTNK